MEEEIKIDSKETKKTRQKKIRGIDQVARKIDINKDVMPPPKEKKRRLFTRTKKEKRKEKTLGVKKAITTSGTRQKRTIREKMKAIVDQLKIKTTKIANSALGIQENSEKVMAFLYFI